MRSAPSAPAVVLAATTAVQIAAALAALTLPAVAPAVARDFGVPTSTVGTYISLVYLGAAVAALLAGTAVLRTGALRVSQLALLACAAGLLLGLAPLLWLAAAAAVVLGLGYGPVTPASSHVLARTAGSAHRNLIFSIKQTGVPAGTSLAGLIAPPLAVAYGWQAAATVVAMLCLLVAAAVQPLRSRLDADRDRSAAFSSAALADGLRLVAAVPLLRTMAAVSFAYAGMQMCVSTFVVAYLAEELRLPLVTAGLALTTANAAGIVARIVWGGIADRWLAPRTTLALIGWLMAAASGAAALFDPGWSLAPLLLVCAALGATAIGWNGVYLSEVARLAPAGRAAVATGGCLFFTFVGVVVCPFLFGWLQRATDSYALCYAVGGVLCAAVAALLSWRSGSPTRPAEAVS
jgi:predicted MFS family arabinose efflux permease